MTKPQTLPRRNTTIWTVATQCVSVASFFGVVVFFAEALYDRPAPVASDCGWTESYVRHIGTQVWTRMVADQSRHEWLYSTWSLSLAPRPILWIFVGQDVVFSYRTGHESTVVLPFAAAFAKLAETASQVSADRAMSVASKLYEARFDSLDVPHKARATLSIGYLHTTANPQGASISLYWQRPNSILEVELLSSQIPVHAVFPEFAASATLPF